jgi:gas vesicle protein
MNAGKLLLGVLAGVAAGALIGVLFAPEKGTETRRKIASKGDDYANGLKEKFNNFLDEVQKEAATASGNSNDLIENGIAIAKV